MVRYCCGVGAYACRSVPACVIIITTTTAIITNEKIKVAFSPKTPRTRNTQKHVR